MKAAEKHGYKLYEVSDDNGYSWKRRWMTGSEAEIMLNNFYRVRECKFGFEMVHDETEEA